ncbi:unnamed protein product [Leptosia nina]|uniref:Uncharacterized protein n=1 Tax=Leptosia nina TaxID=320188 RepID=A0AAV1JU36_9NEOP
MPRTTITPWCRSAAADRDRAVAVGLRRPRRPRPRPRRRRASGPQPRRRPRLKPAPTSTATSVPTRANHSPRLHSYTPNEPRTCPKILEHMERSDVPNSKDIPRWCVIVIPTLLFQWTA